VPDISPRGADGANDATDPPRVVVDGVSFACSDGFNDYAETSDPDVLTLVKTPAMVERLRELIPREPGARVVELGIAFGGSVALLSLLTRPSKLVALELSPEPVAPLARFLAKRGLEDDVKPHYGVDQADRAQLTDIVDAEFAGQPLDLVVDDASHRYRPTRVSFECLFPRLRPGGTYLIEDWSWQHRFAAAFSQAVAEGRPEALEQVAAVLDGSRSLDEEPPLSRFVAELMLMVANQDGIVSAATVDPSWIAVTRGDADLDPATFQLAAVVTDPFGTLSPG
jgi:predicted O-methyltransferase YrrM